MLACSPALDFVGAFAGEQLAQKFFGPILAQVIKGLAFVTKSCFLLD